MENFLEKTQVGGRRMESVDQFRGLAIISMIIVNFLACYRIIPGYLKHARGVGYTVADLVAPFFIFAIGLVYRKSFLNRVARYGRKTAWIHIVRRYLLLLALGFFGTWIAGGGISFEWGVLQAIGAAGLITLLFIEWGFWKRITVALFLLALYQLLIFPSLGGVITIAKHGGIWATISWGAMLLLATAAGDLIDVGEFWTRSGKLAIFGLILCLAGFINLKTVPISKMEVNSSYCLVSTGLSAVAFNAFFIFNDKFRLGIPALNVLGKNALFIYVIHYILIQIVHRLIPSNADLLLVTSGAVAISAFCYGLAWYMDFKKLYLRF